MRTFFRELRQRDLMRPPAVLDCDAVDFARTGPSFRRVQYECRPARTLAEAAAARSMLDLANARDDLIERARHREMRRLAARLLVDVERLVAAAAEQLRQFFARNAREHRRARDLVAVEVQDRQNCAIARGVEKLVRVPAGRERSGLRFAVTDDAGNDQLRIVEGRTVSVRQRVTELAAFMDRAGRFRRNVTGNAARKRELLEKPAQPVEVFRHVRVVLAVRAFEICVRHQRGSAVSRPGDVDHVEVVLVDDAVEVRVDEIQPGRRAPVAEQARLDVLDRQLLREQRVVEQIDLSHRHVVGGTPVGVDTRQVVGSERGIGFGVFMPGTTHSAALSSRRHERVDLNLRLDARIGAAAAVQAARNDPHAQAREYFVAHGAQQVAVAGSERERRTAR